jgi:hypothetical protein
MKAIPLWQPWASLVACGAKRVETRHWPVPPAWLGQRMAIYATKRESDLWLCKRSPFAAYLPEPDLLPRGAIIATVTLARCSEMTEASIAELAERNPDELAFGLYEPGRFAWVLRDVEPLAAAVPFKWPFNGPAKYFEVPDGLLGVATA